MQEIVSNLKINRSGLSVLDMFHPKQSYTLASPSNRAQARDPPSDGYSSLKMGGGVKLPIQL